MTAISTTIAGLSLVAGAAAGPAPLEAPRPAAEVRLAYRFDEGDVIRMEVEKSSRLLAVKGKVRQEQSTTSTTVSRYVVTEVSPKGTATLRYRIERARMQCRFDDQEPIQFDSREEATPSEFRQVREAIGVDRLELVVKPDGSLVETRSLVQDDAAKQADAKKTPKSTRDLFPFLPAEPVRPGDEWTRVHTMRVNVGGSLSQPLTKEMEILHSFQLEAVQDGIATVAFKSSPLESIDDPTIQLQVAPQKASGTFRFDVGRGRVVERIRNVDNLTIGWQGADSSLMTRQSRTEKLIPTEE